VRVVVQQVADRADADASERLCPRFVHVANVRDRLGPCSERLCALLGG
jgi:hypothetical protein